MRFSIIIPVYNKINTIERSLNSVLCQNFDNNEYEIIIVDDGSIDADYRRFEGENIRVIVQKNQGVSAARNTGIKNAKGDYICFLDADDYYLPNNLTVLHNAIEDTGELFYCTIPTIKYSDGTYSSDKLQVTMDGRVEKVDIFEYYLSHPFSFIHTNSVCISRLLLENERFEDGVKIGEDFDLWFRLGIRTKLSIIYTSTIVYDRTESTATKNRNVIADWIFARRTETKEFYDELEPEMVGNIKKLVDRYYMTEAREFSIKEDKKSAYKSLRKVNKKKEWRYFLTCAFIHCPNCLRRYLIIAYDKYQDR